MSYPRDLDEYSDLEIYNEYVRRIDLIRANHCTYCSKPQEICNCKMKNQIGKARQESTIIRLPGMVF